jgi:hypothetical protein
MSSSIRKLKATPNIKLAVCPKNEGRGKTGFWS